MIVCHSRRFVFIKTGKTGSTSVEVALSRLCGPGDVVTGLTVPERGHTAANSAGLFEHTPAATVRALNPDLWDSYLTFCVERNPWDKAVSGWAWWKHRRRNVTFGRYLDMLETKIAAGRPYGQGLWPYNWPSYTDGGDVIVDRVLRYERLGEELRDLGFDVDLPHAKAGIRDRSFRMSASQAVRVGSLFKVEVDAHGYRPPEV